MILSIVGAGGKTTLLHKLAAEYRSQGKKVFVTTSTHMFIEPDTLLTDDADTIISELEEKNYAMAGIQEGEKIRTLSKETYEKVCPHADIVLVEADGSKHLPIKYPNEMEPVIYENTEEIWIVFGLHALGKNVQEAAFRPELVMQCLGISADTKITMEHIHVLIQKGYIEKLQKKYPDKKLKIYLSGAGGGLYDQEGKQISNHI